MQKTEKKKSNQNKHKMLRTFTFKLSNATFHGNVSLLRPPLPHTHSVCNHITVLKQWKRDSHIQWWCWDGPLPALSHSSALLVAGRTWPGSKQTNRTLWNSKTKLTTTTYNRAINTQMNHSQDSKRTFLVNPGLSCDLKNRPRALKQLECHVNILPSTGHEKNAAQPKPAKCLSSTSHFSPFNCCLSVVLYPDIEDYLKNLWHSFEPFMCLDLFKIGMNK